MIDRTPAKALSQSEELALYDHVGKASIQHLRERTAGILIESSNGGVACGSAVAIQVEERTFLLTAAHNFIGAGDSDSSITVFSANRSSKEPLNVIGRNFNAPGADGSNDVAWLEVDVESAKRSTLVGTDIRSIESSELKAEDMCFLMGFPTAFSEKSRDANGALSIIAPMMLYFTHVISDDGAKIVMGYANTGYNPEQGIKEMPSPSGMSGGGVWISPQQPSEASQIWDAGRFKLVGLTIEHWKSSSQVHAVKVAEALKLLAGDKPELKDALGKVISSL